MEPTLNPWYITGFTDGEGCFSLFLNTENKKRKNGNTSQYTYWVTVFAINIRGDDIDILNQIQNYFKCGSVGLFHSPTGSVLGNATFHVKGRKDLITKIIPHFDKFPLQAKKQQYYLLWRKAVLTLNNADKRRLNKFSTQELTQQEQELLLEIKNAFAQSQTLGQKTRSLNSIENKVKGKKIIATPNA